MPILNKIIHLIYGGESEAQPAPPDPAHHVSIADINAALTKLGNQTGATDWQHSIVDLMKLFGVDASLENRIELAHDLGYQGVADAEHTAEMNMWLHKALMANIVAHGGQLKL